MIANSITSECQNFEKLNTNTVPHKDYIHIFFIYLKPLRKKKTLNEPQHGHCSEEGLPDTYSQ